MQHRFILIISACLFWLCLSLPPLAADQETFVGHVIEMIDGDTLSVLYQDKEVRIRLYGIDAPEKKQPHGTEAHLYACGLATRQTITVIGVSKDRYGRLVAKVSLPDGRSLNHEMVRAGMAWWYRQYAPNDVAFASLEEEAQHKKRGLWRNPAPIAPWEWRKR